MMVQYKYTTEEGGDFHLAQWQGESELALRQHVDEIAVGSPEQQYRLDPDKGWLFPFDGRLVHSIILPDLRWRWDAHNRFWMTCWPVPLQRV